MNGAWAARQLRHGRIAKSCRAGSLRLQLGDKLLLKIGGVSATDFTLKMIVAAKRRQRMDSSRSRQMGRIHPEDPPGPGSPVPDTETRPGPAEDYKTETLRRITYPVGSRLVSALFLSPAASSSSSPFSASIQTNSNSRRCCNPCMRTSESQ